MPLDPNKFTRKTAEAVGAAQALAREQNHSQVTSEHLLAALLGQAESVVLPVLERLGVAPKTIRDHVGTLSALFDFSMAPKRRWAITNPCVGVELPAAPEVEEIRFLALDEVDRLLVTCSRARTPRATGSC